MDFELTDDQQALRDAIRTLLAGRFPMAVVRALESVGGVDRDRWHDLRRAGVFDLRVPESDDGVGLGMADAVLVFEELGRALVPGPLVATHLATKYPVLRGAQVVTQIDRAAGPALLVEHLAASDTVLVVDDDGLFRLDAGTLTVAGRGVARPLDPLTPVTEIDPAVVGGGELIGGAGDAEQWRLDGTVLTAALLLGLAGATTDLAVAYAKQRTQFDRPIGAFQAVKHVLADMVTRVEVARAAVYAAGVTVDDPAVGDPARAAAAAKIVAGEAAVANGKSCIQVHGGMGFTWEVDAHLYLKRAWVLDTAFGTPDVHADRVAALL